MPQPQPSEHRPDVVALVRFRGSGRPVGTSQNWHDRVQVPPRMRTVSDGAVPTFADVGQLALSHTVFRPSSATLFFRSKKTSPRRHLHPDPGRFRMPFADAAGGPGLAALFGLEDAQLARAGFDDAGGHLAKLQSTTPIGVTLGTLMHRRARLPWPAMAAVRRRRAGRAGRGRLRAPTQQGRPPRLRRGRRRRSASAATRRPPRSTRRRSRFARSGAALQRRPGVPAGAATSSARSSCMKTT